MVDIYEKLLNELLLAQIRFNNLARDIQANKPTTDLIDYCKEASGIIAETLDGVDFIGGATGDSDFDRLAKDRLAWYKLALKLRNELTYVSNIMKNLKK